MEKWEVFSVKAKKQNKTKKPDKKIIEGITGYNSRGNMKLLM